MREGFSFKKTGIIDQEFGGKIIRAVEDKIVLANYLPYIVGVCPFLICKNINIGIYGLYFILCRHNLSVPTSSVK